MNLRMRFRVLAVLVCAAGGMAAAGPVQVWHFDEGRGDATFSASGDRRAVLTRAPELTRWVEGKSGRGLHVLGSSRRRNASGGIAFEPPEGTFTKPFSIDLWFKFDRGVPYDEKREIINAGHERTSGFRVYFFYRKLYVYTGNGGEHHAFLGKDVVDVVPEDLWHFLSVSYDGREFSLYLNGALVSRSRIDLEDGGRFTLGSYHGYAYPMNGVLDELRIYDHARSRQEILEEYLGGAL